MRDSARPRRSEDRAAGLSSALEELLLNRNGSTPSNLVEGSPSLFGVDDCTDSVSLAPGDLRDDISTGAIQGTETGGDVEVHGDDEVGAKRVRLTRSRIEK